jgi:hypothetical protein
MGYQYGNFYVDERYNRLLRANLYYDSIFQPGVTFNQNFVIEDKRVGRAYIYKLTPTSVKVGQPAKDLEDELVQNDLIHITMNNTFQSSRKLYGVQEATVQFNAISMAFEDSVKAVREAWNKSALTCLITEGTGTTIEGTNLTTANVRSALLDAQSAMELKKTHGKIVLCTVPTYQTILEAAGTLFTNELNNRMVLNSQVGHWLGMDFIRCNLIQKSVEDFTYYDYDGSEKAIQSEEIDKIDFIMFDPEYFCICTNFDNARVTDSPRFFGKLAQMELNSGYRVIEPAGVCIRKHTAQEDESVLIAKKR